MSPDELEKEAQLYEELAKTLRHAKDLRNKINEQQGRSARRSTEATPPKPASKPSAGRQDTMDPDDPAWNAHQFDW